MGKYNAPTASLLQEFFQGSLYKPSQGRVSRQVTFATLAIAVGLAGWKMWNYLSISGGNPALIYGVPVAVILVGMWISYRLVNITRFADFLISVEAEMNKVTWPTRPELVRSSMVVIIVIFFLAFILFMFDLIWRFLFQFIGVIQ